MCNLRKTDLFEQSLKLTTYQQQLLGIPISTKCAPLLADLFFIHMRQNFSFALFQPQVMDWQGI